MARFSEVLNILALLFRPEAMFLLDLKGLWLPLVLHIPIPLPLITRIWGLEVYEGWKNFDDQLARIMESDKAPMALVIISEVG